MEYNVIRENPASTSLFSPVDVKDKKATTLPTCSHCDKEDCSCKKLNKSTKRGYKSHVPSACVNCKTAHLACDISRPCKRCVALNKTDTCHDMQHKKRGRPKLREKRVYSPNENSYEILYGTIQTPAITIKPASVATRNIIPAQQQQQQPFKSTKRTSVISFIHEPIESFQQQRQPELSSPSSSSFSSRQNVLSATSTLDLPSIQLSSNIELPMNNTQPLFLNESNSLLNSPPLPATAPSSTLNIEDTVTIILSMDVCCAKVSDDIIKCWGYYPQELAHRSLYDFISPKDSDRLARLHRLLLNNNTPLPQTESTTSSLFTETEQSILTTKANGSRSFSDTIHIKKRSGEFELYNIVVYIGGGLGADLHDSFTLSKQYIVAQFKRHEYEVMAPPPPPSIFDNSIDILSLSKEEYQPIAVFSPLTPTSPSNNSFNTTTTTTTTSSSSNLDLFRKDFPSYSKVTTAPPPSTISPKFNIAPITSSHSSLQQFISVRPPTTVTHPTQQYFLQTSSSTLNAAASAAQNKSRPTSSEQNVVAPASGRKMEMSIRSLLC